MRRLRFGLPVLVFAALMTWAQSKPAPTAASDPLEPVAWIVGGTWVADVQGPDGRGTHIENRIRWAANRRAVEFHTDFNREPHYNGFYAWDPSRKVIGFWYTSAEGEFTSGVATPEADGKTLRQEFTVAQADGRTSTYRSTLFHDAPDSYLFTVFSQRDGDWAQMFQIRYARK